ncbi:lamin tail domain-containing protein [Eisenibacter elegans]|uniref:lamin tail domain-containing protein n=1 Tax=Eisenibacter elegans TaxID=997 RepID=UPI0004085BC6|nr:lamin tail domain-containing protein [Eisenibacter elegans]
MTYNFSGLAGEAPQVDVPPGQPANGTATPIVRSANLGSASSSNQFAANQWGSGATIDLTKYFSFSIQANSGFVMTLNTLNFTLTYTGTGPSRWVVRSSLDGFANNIGDEIVSSGTGSIHSITLPIAFANIAASTNVEFRIYGYGASGTTGAGRLSALNLQGSIAFPDTDPPSLVSVSSVSATQVAVLFSEAIQTTSAQNTANYGLAGNTVTAAAQDGGNPARVVLTLANSLLSGEDYTLQVQNVQDIAGNAMGLASLSFRHYTFTDNFSDGDFTNNPTWSGTTADFTVENGELRLNASVAGQSYLTLPLDQADEWIFKVRLTFEPSNTNQARIYLVSNTANLSSPDLRGYYIRIGENGANDPIELYRQDGSNSTLLIRGPLGQVAVNPNITIRVARSQTGIWAISADPSGGFNFSSNTGTATDATYVPTGFFGFLAIYTITNANRFYFDNVVLLDRVPPTVLSVTQNAARGLLVRFSEPVAQASAQNVANYSVNNGLGNPTSAVQSGDNPAEVSLTFGQDFSASTQNTLTVQNIVDRSTNPAPNTMTVAQNLDFSLDNTAPSLLRVRVIGTNQLAVIFSEPVAQASAQNTANYSLEGVGNPSTAVQNTTRRDSVVLTWGNEYEDLRSYTLTVQNIADAVGNTLTNATANFTYFAPYTPVAGDVIINEIMAAPSPVVGQPNAEYVELYNRTPRSLDLSRWRLEGASTSTGNFGNNVSIPPNGYLLLTANGNRALFSGNVVGWGGTSTTILTNSGKELVLQNQAGEDIDRVTYSEEWHTSSEKQNGGWALERINPETPCSGANNWTSSTSPSGGTPLAQNAVFSTAPDLSAPRVRSVIVVSATEIIIRFDKRMDAATLNAVGNYSINPTINIQSATAIPTAFESVRLILATPLVQGQVYSLALSSLKDCPGNDLPATTQDFGLGFSPQYQEVVMTEIMSNPNPVVGLPALNFIEIYNRSDKLLSLEGCRLNTGGSANDGVIQGLSLLPGEYALICASSSVTALQRFGKVVGVSNFSLTIGGRTLVLKNANNQLLHTVSYRQGWYGASEKRNGGWTLEMIDTDYPCVEQPNWLPSENASGGTPNRPNSVRASKPDLTPPTVRNVFARSADTVQVYFNEKMDSLSLVNGQYTLNNGASLSLISVRFPDAGSVVLRVSPALQARTSYTLTVRNVRDCSGNVIADQNSGTFGIPEPADSSDIILNEILFNARTGSSKFVELYNRSEKYISLRGWQLANVNSSGVVANQRQITTDLLVIGPRSYLVLSDDPSSVKAQYPRGKEETFFELNLPSYAQSRGSFILLNPRNRVWERFDYDERMHNPLVDNRRGVSLERISFSAPSNEGRSWQSAATRENFATPGYLNSQSVEGRSLVAAGTVTIEPRAITPDGDGHNDFATISYRVERNGRLGRIQIYDSNGLLVRDIASSDLLGVEGFYVWDGTDNQGQKVRMGYYVVFVEVFDADGVRQLIKEKIAVGARF